MRKILGFTLLAVLVALVALWLAILKTEPAVPPQPAGVATAADLERLHNVLRQRLRLLDHARADIVLAESDINRLLGHVLSQQGWPIATRVDLREAGVGMRITYDTALPRRWLNIHITLHQEGNSLQPVAATIGSLPVPAALLPGLHQMAQAQLRRHEAWPAIEQAIASIEHLDIHPQRLHARLMVAEPLRSELAAHQGDLLFGPAVKRRVPVYIRALHMQLGRDETVPLTDLLPTLFSHARSEHARGADAGIDNRALLLALTLHSVPAELLQTMGGTDLIATTRAQRVRLTLHGRHDLAQHFLISALLASYGDEALASRAGMYKELRDRTSGSGFDATDLLADYAGMTFGALAATEPLWLQEQMQQPRPANHVMPPTDVLSPAASKALQQAAASGGLATLQRAAEVHLLPLLLTTPLYRELPQGAGS